MIKKIDDELYQLVCGWWFSHGWPVLPRNLLPKRGYVVFEDEKPIMAGFLYKEESCDFGMFDFIVSDPYATSEQKDKCLAELVSHVEAEAKSIGISLMWTISSKPKLTERLCELGFIKSKDGYVVNLIKNLGG